MRKTPETDVLIVGAGVFGLSCAYACARRGMRVIVTDAAAGLGAGASGGLVGALSPHPPDAWSAKKRFQFDALIAAPAFWAEVAATGGGEPGYARPGRLIPLATAAARTRAEARAAGAAALWDRAAEWTVQAGGDWLAPDAAPYGAVFETLSARLNPRGALAALAAAVLARGGDLRFGWRAREIEDRAARFDQGRIAAGAAILAVGVGGPALAPALPCRGVKGQAALLAADAPADAPLIFADGVYVVPQPDGRVAVGSTSEDVWEDAIACDARLDAVVARARALRPALADAPVVARWAALRPRAARPDPMLGPMPGRDGVLIAAGGFKTGFGLAPAVGEILADMVEGRSPPLPDGFAVADHLAARVRR